MSNTIIGEDTYKDFIYQSEELETEEFQEEFRTFVNSVRVAATVKEESKDNLQTINFDEIEDYLITAVGEKRAKAHMQFLMADSGANNSFYNDKSKIFNLKYYKIA